MGTHPKCPSTVLGTETPLQDVLAQSPVELLGPAVAKAYGPQLPFLFKVSYKLPYSACTRTQLQTTGPKPAFYATRILTPCI